MGRLGSDTRPVLRSIAADRLDIDLAADATSKRRLCLRIRRTGVAVAAEHPGSLFVPFVQVDVTSARTRGGRGPGLTITHHFAPWATRELTVERRSAIDSVLTRPGSPRR